MSQEILTELEQVQTSLHEQAKLLSEQSRKQESATLYAHSLMQRAESKLEIVRDSGNEFAFFYRMRQLIIVYLRMYCIGTNPYAQVSRENADFVSKIALLEAETSSYQQHMQSLQGKLETASSELASQIIASSRQQEAWESRSAVMQLDVDTAKALADQVRTDRIDIELSA